MSEVRALLDRLADIEATISTVARDVTAPSTPMRLALQSLEMRRGEILAELNEAAGTAFVDICNYRFIADIPESYTLNLVTQALRSFQDIVTSVYDAITTRPKIRGSWDPLSVVNTAFSFGYSYSGSLGVVLSIPNERLLGVESHLDAAVIATLDAVKVKNSNQVAQFADKYGISAIRYLYQWSKVHADHAVGAAIQWRRQETVRYETFEQFQEFRELCELIERGSEPVDEEAKLVGELLAFDAVTRRFRLAIDDAPDIRGHLARDFDANIPRTIHQRYFATLTERTVMRYATGKEEISWILGDLREIIK